MPEDANEQLKEPETLDLAVVGAGIYGIQAARTYLHLHPQDRVLIFEAAESIGGVWSSDRVYDAFWTQTPLKILEFSDMPLENVPDSDSYHGFFPAKHVSRYLQTYVATRIYNGKSLAARIRTGSKVEVLTKQNNHWLLNVESRKGTSRAISQYCACKVIDATGLTSTANLPCIAGQQEFQGIILHHKDFGRYQESLLSRSGPQKIVVIGGAKSAADVAYAGAKAGKDITWIIRLSGAGPAAFVAAKGRGMYWNSNESFYTRFVAYFLASIFHDEPESWFEWFLHRTAIGRRTLQLVWKSINSRTHTTANYERSDGKDNGFHNLKPDTEIFWQNDSTGICLHEDFFDTIACHAIVYRQDIVCLNETGLELADGSQVEADAIVFATGWRTSHPNICNQKSDNDLRTTLGLSVSDVPQEDVSLTKWDDLEKTYEADVLKRFPILRAPPPYYQRSADKVCPLRLYKGILPVSDRSIAFLGQMMLGNHFRAAEVQSLYAVAALDGVLKLPSESEMQIEIAKTTLWCRLRYLSKGLSGNWIYWDLVPYTDNLLAELDLQSHRHTAFWKDLFSPCFADDLKHLMEEYSLKYNRQIPPKG